MHADAIDILIDLDGFTAMTRPEIAAMRPAPVRARYLVRRHKGCGFPRLYAVESVIRENSIQR
jgi:hypothetical protein